VLPTLTARCAIGFLRRAVAWFAERGVQIKALMSDNGSAYVAHAYIQALTELGLRHLRIRPYRPRTNGKAERFIQTLQNEWAYSRIYGSSPERAAALPLFLSHYNFRRPHGSLGHQPPAARLTNLPGNYSYAASETAGRGDGRAVGPVARLSERRNAAVARLSLSR
jgi:transposase InsO family protein